MIRVFTGLEGAQASVRVEDTGIGISWMEQGRVFEPFDRGGAEAGAGGGMGLTIARRLAEIQGGSISLRSRPGEGSTFTLSIAAAGGDMPSEDPLSSVTLPVYRDVSRSRPEGD